MTFARVEPAGSPGMTFTDDQVHRYARHILLGEVGGTGQARLLGSRVLVIGAGGLGSPLSMYLAAAGVGTLGIVDDDVVDLSNLQRQIVHATTSVGMAKVDSARATLAAINPDVTVIAHRERITAANALRLISDYDVVADGSDNFPTRFLVNDACFFARRPLVSGAVLRFDGQISTFKAFQPAAGTGEGEAEEHGPCYRCLFREPPPPGQIPSCAEAGVLGAFCGLVGSLQATEVLKELLGIGESKIKIRRDPGCPLCGDAPSITDLSIHDA